MYLFIYPLPVCILKVYIHHLYHDHHHITPTLTFIEQHLLYIYMYIILIGLLNHRRDCLAKAITLIG